MSNFQPLDVVGRDSETQLQGGENVNKLNWLQDKGCGLDCMLLYRVYILHFKVTHTNVIYDAALNNVTMTTSFTQLCHRCLHRSVKGDHLSSGVGVSC